MQRIALSNGIVPARDDQVPEQASFVVPNLGITIVPLVYGDRHCWDLAYLSGQAADVPRHLHSEGVEIHLGYGKLRGFTVLGDCRAEVAEGYAMSIPAGTPHGFVNTSGHDHFLPFVFGSSRLGGWGIVLDVAPQPVDMRQLPQVPADAAAMNGLVFLDREVDRTAAFPGMSGLWWPLPPHIARIPGPWCWPSHGLLRQDWLIRRVHSESCRSPGAAAPCGSAKWSGTWRRTITRHPRRYGCRLAATGRPPLVALDAVLSQ